MSFEFKITETRTYLNGTTEDDSPFVSGDERSIATAPTAKEIAKKIKEFVKSFKSEASIGEVFEDGGGNYEIRIDIENAVVRCELTNELPWTKSDRELIEKL